MAPPPKAQTPKSLSQSNTLFNYFSRTPTTPKSPTTTPGPSSTTNGNGTSKDNGDGTPKRKKDENGDITPKPRRLLHSPQPSTSSATKNGKKRRRISSGSPDSPRESVELKKQKVKDDSGKKRSRKPAKSEKKKPEDDDCNDEDEYPASDEESTQEDSEEYDPSSAEEESSEEDEAVASDQSDASESCDTSLLSSPEEKRGKRNNKKKTTKEETNTKKGVSASAQARLGKFVKDDTPNGSPKAPTPSRPTPKRANNKKTVSADEDDEESSQGQWSHLKYDFLRPEKIKDSNGRPPSHPNYNPKTLNVPEDFLRKVTPGMKQWWKLKAQHFDTILFFKLGKFYEFYHMDAVIAAEELKLLYMKGDYCHVGFPEAAFSENANKLLERGYKIARIEQTETPDMLTERNKKQKTGDKDKVVKREICQISTIGARTASFQDKPYITQFAPDSKHLYAIIEKITMSGQITYGICFIDTTIGQFNIGQFTDDRHRSRLRTLLAHYVPAQLLLLKGNLHPNTEQLVLNGYAGLRKDIRSSKEFPDSSTLLRRLGEKDVFQKKEKNTTVWPDIFNEITSDSFTAAADGWELGLQALGAVESYLDECLIGHDLLTLKKFVIYKPVDAITKTTGKDGKMQQYMVLDGITLQNLDITEGEKTLVSLVDNCNTSFGKRLLREWVCSPLAIPEEIDARLDAIDELLEFDDFTGNCVQLLKPLPDLERLLNKAHMLGSAHRSKNHPDGRAIMFDETKYSKNKIIDLLSILKGFKSCNKIIELLEGVTPKSDYLLKTIIGRYPKEKILQLLKQFDEAFDHSAAAKDGKIIPAPGVDEDYEEAKHEMNEITNEANEYLRDIAKQLRTTVTYFGTDKKRFQLEVPASLKVPSDFEYSTAKKGYKRFVTPSTKKFLSDMLKAESKQEEALRDVTRKIFERFDSAYNFWKQSVECIGMLDAILSLTIFSSSQVGMCRPRVIYSQKPFICIKDGRHPCMPIDSYISNSCAMGDEKHAPFVLLTGPNMGGKSTYMRQVALLTILSHLGCHVPASSCEMSVVDRIFTRLGAADNIGEGESTFFVELSETSAALRHCTKNSLVLMDELGRGTATYDGTAIAHAVSTKLAKDGIRSLFSTHYHTLVETIQHLPNVQMGHMACLVENENDEDPTDATITFLYKLAPGPCPKSYGFNAAKLAGIPDEVIRVAHQKAKEFETATKNVDTFRKIITGSSLSLSKAMHLLSVF